MSTHPAEVRLPADLAPGQAAKFTLDCHGKRLEGFLVNHAGHFHAYLNRCAHVGTPLDMWPNEFFTEDGGHLICATHGAIYLPETGVCVEGPCRGASLTRLPLAIDGAQVVISCPTERP